MLTPKGIGSFDARVIDALEVPARNANPLTQTIRKDRWSNNRLPGDPEMFAVLQPIERQELLQACIRHPFVADVLAQLVRTLSSRTFARVQKAAKDFLTFAVSRTLLGQAFRVKQTTIAMAVFGEGADFNPLETSRIRVAGALLRKRMALYIRDEGSDDPIVITIPKGSYVPDIRDRRTTIYVEELAHWGSRGQRSVGALMTDEIARFLQEKRCFRVARASSKVGPGAVRYRLRGSVGSVDAVLRLSISLFDIEMEKIAYWQTFEIARPKALTLPIVIATSISAALAKTQSLG